MSQWIRNLKSSHPAAAGELNSSFHSLQKRGNIDESRGFKFPKLISNNLKKSLFNPLDKGELKGV